MWLIVIMITIAINYLWFDVEVTLREYRSERYRLFVNWHSIKNDSSIERKK